MVCVYLRQIADPFICHDEYPDEFKSHVQMCWPRLQMSNSRLDFMDIGVFCNDSGRLYNCHRTMWDQNYALRVDAVKIITNTANGYSLITQIRTCDDDNVYGIWVYIDWSNYNTMTGENQRNEDRVFVHQEISLRVYMCANKCKITFSAILKLKTNSPLKPCLQN